MKDLTLFIESELKPRLWNYYPQIFPELRLTLSMGKYTSQLHNDGTEGTGTRKDRCVITQKYPYKVYDQTKGAKDVITLFMELNNISETYEAVNRLCGIVGIQRPEYTQEAKERYRQYEERRNALEASAARQREALFAPEGKAVLEYLHGRAWTDEEIKEAELGFISEAEATTINAQRAIGTTHTLSIPLRSGSTLYGFKVRTIENALPDGTQKYQYTQGTNKKSNLFNLTGIKQTDGRIVVVEGELDALHAQVKGLKNIVATGGGFLTEELLTAALARGIKNITLLFDADKRGADFVRKSIDIAYTKGVAVMVATYPEGEKLANGTPIHDIDEYLQAHTIEELQTLIENARYGTIHLYAEAVKEYTNDTTNITDEIASKVISKVIALGNQTPNQVEREYLFSICAYDFNIDGKEAFSVEALRAEANKQRAATDALKQENQTKQAIATAKAQAESGNIRAALQTMGEAANALKQIDKVAKYSELLALPTEQSRSQNQSKGADDIETSYYFETTGVTKEIERLTLPSGAITFVCAPTSHGKSTFLQNLALSVVQNGTEGSTLYFTFEESREAVEIQLVNKYINKPLSANNQRSITTYKRKGKNFFTGDGLNTYLQGDREFAEKLLYSGKLRIYEEDYDSTELIEAIRYICSQTKVKAVFIDYIQMLSKNGCRLQRNEELKEISKDFKSLAVSLHLPIIVAAQLNREAKSPVEMFAQNIAEAADLERVANKVILLWNSSFKERSKDSSSHLKEWSKRTGIELGQGGTIYALLAKNRGGIVNIEAVLTHHGNEGVITQQKPTLQQIEAAQGTEELPFGQTDTDDSDPF